MKAPLEYVNRIEDRVALGLRGVLERVPGIRIANRGSSWTGGPAVDAIDLCFTAHVPGRSKPYTILCEVKHSGQPRHIRNAALQVRSYAAARDSTTVPLVGAPYLSPQARIICDEHGVGYLDLEGNCKIAFDGVYIERAVTSKPPAEQREFRGIFRPRAAQVLRVLLRDPSRAWRLAELADVAGVSLGHVSNVKTALLEREWATASPEGLSLARPAALLDAWGEAYRPPGQPFSFYTSLHGGSLEKAIRDAQREGSDVSKYELVFRSFSAARWIAPFARTGTTYFYADAIGLTAAVEALRAHDAEDGANVHVMLVDDPVFFRDQISPAPGIRTTSELQTYLDLFVAGERGREAAQHLRAERLPWAQ